MIRGRAGARAVAAELVKLATLPVVVAAAASTVVVAGLLAWALGATARTYGTDASAVDVVLRAVPFVQAGMLLLGILPVAHEYQGRQLRTTLAAVPQRGRVVVAKSIAALGLAAAVAGATVAVAIGVAALASGPGHGRGTALPESSAEAGSIASLAGAAAALALTALLAHAVALALRHLVPTLVVLLVLVYVLPPLLAGVTEHARWLPNRGLALLAGGTDGALTATTGGLLVLAWIAAIGAAGTVGFLRRDA